MAGRRSNPSPVVISVSFRFRIQSATCDVAKANDDLSLERWDKGLRQPGHGALLRETGGGRPFLRPDWTTSSSAHTNIQSIDLIDQIHSIPFHSIHSSILEIRKG